MTACGQPCCVTQTQVTSFDRPCGVTPTRVTPYVWRGCVTGTLVYPILGMNCAVTTATHGKPYREKHMINIDNHGGSDKMMIVALMIMLIVWVLAG